MLGPLQSAVDAFARLGIPLEEARSRLLLARALLRDASPDGARTACQAALAAFERLGAARDIDEARALMRQVGSGTRPNERTNEPLTKREKKVLALLGLGLSNPEIGARLYVSRKTVEYHVSNVLAKLGLRSRAEAAAYAIRAQGETRVPS